MNALRLNDGFAPQQFEQCTGETLHVLTKTLIDAEQQGLLQRDPHRISATPLGLRFLDTLLERFMEGDRTAAGKSGGSTVSVINIRQEG